MTKMELQKTWGQLVTEDPRYRKVKRLVDQERFEEAQALENVIMDEVLSSVETQS